MLVGLIALCGCGAPSPAGDEDGSAPTGGEDGAVHRSSIDVRYHTQYVDIAPGFTQQVCRGTLDEIDRHVERVADILDIDVQARLSWYWFNDEAQGAINFDRCEWCFNCASCFSNGAIYSSNDAIFHEIVHGLVIPAWGGSDRMFSEGVPEGLRGTHIPYLSTTPTDQADEHPSPHFSRWLLDSFGAEKLRRLFGGTLAESSTREDVFSAVAEVYGIGFEELEAEYLATAALLYPAPGMCDGLEHIQWQGDRWELNLAADCDMPYMFGPRDEDGATYAVVTLDIPPELEGVILASWSPTNERATLFPCIEDPQYEESPFTTVMTNSIPQPLAPRRYRLELPVHDTDALYVRICPHNGAAPSLDPADDPLHCVGD